MTALVDEFRQLYNTIRPHEALAGDRPIERYLANPDEAPPTAVSAPLPTRQPLRIP